MDCCFLVAVTTEITLVPSSSSGAFQASGRWLYRGAKKRWWTWGHLVISFKGFKEISKQFVGVTLLVGLGASVQSQLQGTEIEHQVSQGIVETRKPLYKVKKKARQQSVYLGHPGVNWIIAGGRASFH